MPQRPEDVDLQGVDVLVLVHADVVELARQRGPDPLVAGEGSPVEEQVVEVEDAERALAGHVRPAQVGDRLDTIEAPRRLLVDDGRQRLLGVDRPGVEVEQRRLAGEAPALRVGQAQLVRGRGR